MKISWTVLKLYCGHDFVTETTSYKVQRGITKNIYIQELWFLRSACRPVLVNSCMKFHEDILNSCKVIEGHDFLTKTTTYKVQRGITKNIYPSWALHVVQCWFHEDILNGFQLQGGHDFVTERQTDRQTDEQTDGRTDGQTDKRIDDIITVL